jgi:hypothetical protein
MNSPTVHAAAPNPEDPTIATVRASKHHAETSSTTHR